MPFDWQAAPVQVFEAGYDFYIAQLSDELYNLALYYAPQIEAWLKANAKWTDRTGNARQTLFAEALHLIHQIAIEFDYGVWYGELLEFQNGGRYAIIGPALDHWTSIIWEAIQALMS